MKTKHVGWGGLLAVALVAPVALTLGIGESDAAANATERVHSVERTPAERVDTLEIETGSVKVDEDHQLRNQPRMTQGRDAHSAAQAFVDALTWSLTSDASAKDPALVPDALGGALNSMDAEMLKGFDRESPASIDPEAGAYRILGYSGDEKNPDQVMVEVSVPMERDGELTMLVVGGVMTRSAEGWIPTSMRPRDHTAAPVEIDTADEVVDELESGEHGIGWLHLGEETQ